MRLSDGSSYVCSSYLGNEAFDIFGCKLEVDGIDVGKALEQHRLAFHHWLRCQSPKIAETEDRGSVGDHRHQIALGRVIVGSVWIGCDCLYGGCYPWRISQREIALCRHRFGRNDFDLPGPRSEEHTSELQSLMRISYAVFCLKHKKNKP